MGDLSHVDQEFARHLMSNIDWRLNKSNRSNTTKKVNTKCNENEHNETSVKQQGTTKDGPTITISASDNVIEKILQSIEVTGFRNIDESTIEIDLKSVQTN